MSLCVSLLLMRHIYSAKYKMNLPSVVHCFLLFCFVTYFTTRSHSTCEEKNESRKGTIKSKKSMGSLCFAKQPTSRIFRITHTHKHTYTKMPRCHSHVLARLFPFPYQSMTQTSHNLIVPSMLFA